MKNKLALLFLATIGTFALSASTTGNLTLRGVVNGVIDITVTAEAAATDLDLSSFQSDLKVATVNERSNKASGYTVTIESANAKSASSSNPSLNNTDGKGDSMTYSLKYDGSKVVFTNGIATVTDSSSVTSASGIDKDLLITYMGSTSLSEGTYEDSLIFTIAAK